MRRPPKSQRLPRPNSGAISWCPGSLGAALEGARGFSLVEVLVATVIATIAIVGLAYTFSLGRGFINRFEVARAALGAAEARLETMAQVAAFDTLVTPNQTHMSYFLVAGRVLGTERWVVTWIDDPADGEGGADLNPKDLREAVVTVVFHQGSAQDSLQLSQVLPPL